MSEEPKKTEATVKRTTHHYVNAYAYEDMVAMLKEAMPGEWNGTKSRDVTIYELKEKPITIEVRRKVPPSKYVGNHDIVVTRFKEKVGEQEPLSYFVVINFSNVMQQWYAVSDAAKPEKFAGFKEDFKSITNCISFHYIDNDEKYAEWKTRRESCKRKETEEEKKKKEEKEKPKGYTTKEEAQKECDKLSALGYTCKIAEIKANTADYKKGARYNISITTKTTDGDVSGCGLREEEALKIQRDLLSNLGINATVTRKPGTSISSDDWCVKYVM